MSLIHHVNLIFWPQQLLWQGAMFDNHIKLELRVESHMSVSSFFQVPAIPSNISHVCLKRTTCFSSNWPKYSCFIPLLTSGMFHWSLSQSVEYYPIFYVGGDFNYFEAFKLFFWFYTMHLFFICNSIAFSSNMFDTSHPQYIKLGVGQRRVLHVWSNTMCNKSLNFKYI